MIRLAVDRHAGDAQCRDGEIGGPLDERRYHELAAGTANSRNASGNNSARATRRPAIVITDAMIMNATANCSTPQHVGQQSSTSHSAPAPATAGKPGHHGFAGQQRQRIAPPPDQPQADRHDDEAVRERFRTDPDRHDRRHRLRVHDEDAGQGQERCQHGRASPRRPGGGRSITRPVSRFMSIRIRAQGRHGIDASRASTASTPPPYRWSDRRTQRFEARGLAKISYEHRAERIGHRQRQPAPYGDQRPILRIERIVLGDRRRA